MKSKLIFFLVPLFFFSCATVQKTIRDDNSKRNKIYYYESMAERMISVHGKVLEDGSFVAFYPGTIEYENAEIIEITVKEVPSYYVLDKNTMIATVYDKESNDDGSLVLKKAETKRVDTLDFELSFAVRENENMELKSGGLLVDKSKKLWPEKFGSKELMGTWIGSGNENPRRRITFGENNTFVDENYIEDDFYLIHYYPYQKLNENIISVQSDTISKMSGKMVHNIMLYYYDGSFIYDIVFPLKDVSEDKEIQETLSRLK